jgi:hypothetical protein
MFHFIGSTGGDPRIAAVSQMGLPGLMAAIRANAGMTVADLGARVAATDSAVPAAMLTKRLAVVLEKPYPEDDALIAFRELPADARTPLGAESIEYAQVDHSGEIGVLSRSSGQANVPTNGNPDVVTDLRQPEYFCSVVRLSLRDQQAMAFLGDGRIDSLAARIDSARRIHFRREFGVGGYAWTGYPSALGPFGFFNHPGIARDVRSVPYVTASGGQAIVQDLSEAIQLLDTSTLSVAKTTRVLIAQKLWASLNSLTYSAQLGDTLAKLVQINNPGIEFVPLQSLNDSGPNGEHGIITLDGNLPYAAGLDIIAPPTILPVQHQGYDDLYYMWHATGGFKSIERFGLILHWIPTA